MRCLHDVAGNIWQRTVSTKKSGSPTAAAAKGTPQPKAPPQQHSSSTSSTTSNKNVRIEEPSSTSGTSASPQKIGAADLKEVLADVGKMLKAMSATSLKRATVAEDALIQRANDPS